MVVAPRLELVYKTVQDMKNDVNLHVGNTCRTLGYWSPGDEGNGEYYIINKSDIPTNYTVDEGMYILLSNQKVAALVSLDTIHVAQYGVVHDASTKKLDNAANVSRLTLALKYLRAVKFSRNKTYTFSSSINVSGGSMIEDIDLNGSTLVRNYTSGNGLFYFNELRTTLALDKDIYIKNGTFKDTALRAEKPIIQIINVNASSIKYAVFLRDIIYKSDPILYPDDYTTSIGLIDFSTKVRTDNLYAKNIDVMISVMGEAASTCDYHIDMAGKQEILEISQSGVYHYLLNGNVSTDAALQIENEFGVSGKSIEEIVAL